MRVSPSILVWFILALFAWSGWNRAAIAESMGELRTDSRAPYVHRLSLYNAEGKIIDPKDETPYSPSATCGKCHDCAVVRSGWHFNAPDETVAPGRPGEPWILTDLPSGTQLPISNRTWPGVYAPAEVGLTPWQFTLTFGLFTPGGGLGDQYSQKPQDSQAKWKTSGRLEIDCLSCHSADPGRDQTVWAKQIEEQNFQWAPVAAEGLATVRGSAKEGSGAPGDVIAEADPAAAERPTSNVKIIYDAKRFDADDRVLFQIPRRPPNDRCLFCHSSRPAAQTSKENPIADGDVHLARGMSCADCHRNSLDHAIARGDDEPKSSKNKTQSSTLTCRGCHESGRLGAPRPIHADLPRSHLRKLSCTACHSGLPVEEQPHSVRIARAHRLGIPSMHRRHDEPPFIVEPVFVRPKDGKIEPRRMMWPAFWSCLKGDKVVPLPREVVVEAVQKALGVQEVKSKTWKPLDEGQVKKIFEALAAKKLGEVVYVCRGRLYRLGADGKITDTDHPAAQPYSWPVAHDVRPAGQSLGSRGCKECHSDKSGFFFGRVVALGPAQLRPPVTVLMHEMAGLKSDDVKAWNASIRHRKPWGVVNLVAAAVLILVLSNAIVLGLGAVLRAMFVRGPRGGG